MMDKMPKNTLTARDDEREDLLHSVWGEISVLERLFTARDGCDIDGRSFDDDEREGVRYTLARIRKDLERVIDLAPQRPAAQVNPCEPKEGDDDPEFKLFASAEVAASTLAIVVKAVESIASELRSGSTQDLEAVRKNVSHFLGNVNDCLLDTHDRLRKSCRACWA